MTLAQENLSLTAHHMMTLSESHASGGRQKMKIPWSSRIIIVLASLMLSLTYFLPLWQIDLKAPQYPEGLGLEIWINGIEGANNGDLAKINNLNHYIGMKQIKPESIKELEVMPWVMRGIMLLGIAAGLAGRRKLVLIWVLAFVLVSLAGLVDFYLWGYDYGHNLDADNAIIKVPGMSYQPPLLGSKKLLNFTAVSLPGSGGWVAIGALIAGALVYVRELYRVRLFRKESTNVA